MPISTSEPSLIKYLTVIAFLCVVVAICSCGGDAATGTTGTAGTVAAVRISPATVTFDALDQTHQLTATATDASGNTVSASFSWTSTDPGVVDVDGSGLTTAVSNGVVVLRATASGVTGEANGTVQQVAVSIDVTPSSTTLMPGETVQLTATPVDANDHPVAGLAVQWSGSNDDIASVDNTGMVTAGQLSLGSATITANVSSQGSGDASVEVAVSFASVTTGVTHTCALSGNDGAFCWGNNSNGQLGRPGSTTNTCGGPACRQSPTSVEGSLLFGSVSRGTSHTCGVTTAGEGYCWGFNSAGQLGDGSMTSTTAPVTVTGGHQFAVVTTGDEHTCGIASDGNTRCWGKNDLGQLGDGSNNNSSQPLTVTGGITFVSLAAGTSHTCGLTVAGTAYCWGRNDLGQLGGTSVGTCGGMDCSTSPVAVSGGLSFTMVSSTGHHTCGVATGDVAYCWGWNGINQLGATTAEMCNGMPCSTAPVAVSGGIAFSFVTAGEQHSCGIDEAGAAHCWGRNDTGQLGDGTGVFAASPVAVAGGLTYVSVSAGGSHSCGLTTGGLVYCWGQNGSGQLGIGSRDDQLQPELVLGQR
jgi:alpha-tubulin suppressor-like RCC1 family protein